MAEGSALTPLFDAAGVRALEERAQNIAGLDERELMERAGAAAFTAARNAWPRARRITVVCGVGNNAGDGYVVARLAQVAGLDVRCVQVGDTERLTAHASASLAALRDSGVDPGTALEDIETAELVVDAVFGLGLTRPVVAPFAAVIETMNRAAAPVVSLDVPSGLHPDTGCCLGPTVRATMTVTFIAGKQGLYTGDAPNHCGRIVVAALGLPANLVDDAVPAARLLERTAGAPVLQPRSRTAHKGHAGHVLVVGGAPGYAGAIRLAAEAAARCGAGLTSVATDSASVPVVNAGRPELMVHAVASPTALAPLLERASVVAIGPGLGRSAWADGLLAAVFESSLPLVVDADALNALADNPTHSNRWVLTPHPGEAARLIASTAAAVNADRFLAARTLQERYGGSVILKGAGSIVVGPGGAAVVRGGNPGMASGGMGDVLTGIVAALMAQGASGETAARIGASIHAHAADRAAHTGERGLLASDLMRHIRALVNGL